MNKLNFLRPRTLRIRKTSAHINNKGFRVNSDDTTIKNRKPNIKVMPNHKVFVSRPIIVFNLGSAIRDKDTGELRLKHKNDYGMYTTEKLSQCQKQMKPWNNKIHKKESLEQFKLRRKKCNKIRRDREKQRRIVNVH